MNAHSLRGARGRVLALLLALASIAAAPAVASAASLSIDPLPASATAQRPNDIRASGTADQPAYVSLIIQVNDGRACAATPGEERGRGNAGTVFNADDSPRNGPFEYPAKYQINSPGSYIVCGYLSASQGATPDAVATAGPVRMVPDSDQDGLNDEQDRCPQERGIDYRNNQPTADGCAIRDTDNDGVVDGQDKCPQQPGTDARTGQPTSDGCPPPDADGDGVADSLDRCPQQDSRDPATGRPTADGCPTVDTDRDGVPDGDDACKLQARANGFTGGEDPAHKGCPNPLFKLFFAQTWDTLRGVRPKGNVPNLLKQFLVSTVGFEKATSFEFSITLSKASAKTARIAKREIVSKEFTLPAGVGGAETRFTGFKIPKPSAANRKKLQGKKVKKLSFTYEFVVRLASGGKVAAKENYTLKKDKGTGTTHTVYGPSKNDGGEEG